MAVSRLSIIKFLELAIAITCLGLHLKSLTNDAETDTVSAAAFGGFIIILIGGFAGHLMSTPISKKIDVFFCIAGVALFITAGALNIKEFDRYGKSQWKDTGLAKGSLAIINALFFLIDAFLTWRGEY